ncbi:MAG: NAD(P)/FAD-dependent oxidoreductase [Defluviitaleaceae bacterium]|nr:NAD(P)/FAD-dependent oxidoreductase [Defluviitaleaceae bacterium]
MKKIAVIGGGPAGMIAAGAAAESGACVHLYEKNEKLGKKLHITGKGRCNITNAVLSDTYLENIVSNPKFLFSAIRNFDCFKTIDFFENLGVKTKVERGNRVFPMSDKASDVVTALECYTRKSDVKIHLGSAVKEIVVSDNAVKGVLFANDKTFDCDSVIIATGGLSYPGTGSTGDGYEFARKTGHNVTKLYPSLVPLLSDDIFIQELQGLSLKNVEIKVFAGDKVIYKDFGELLFTHFGLSGPIILSASAYLHGKYKSDPVISIDLKPALSKEELDKRLLKDFEKYINKDFANALDDLLPGKIIPVIINRSGIARTKKVHDITKLERRSLVDLLKSFTCSVKGVSGFSNAVITKGGVSVKDIDPKSMRSKITEGIYFAGEVIDVDGYTGGFNLQIAFSTGYLAGKSV